MHVQLTRLLDAAMAVNKVADEERWLRCVSCARWLLSEKIWPCEQLECSRRQRLRDFELSALEEFIPSLWTFFKLDSGPSLRHMPAAG